MPNSQITIFRRNARHSEMKDAILVRLRDRLKITMEFLEPDHDLWRMHQHQADLLNALIVEIEEMQDV